MILFRRSGDVGRRVGHRGFRIVYRQSTPHGRQITVHRLFTDLIDSSCPRPKFHCFKNVLEFLFLRLEILVLLAAVLGSVLALLADQLLDARVVLWTARRCGTKRGSVFEQILRLTLTSPPQISVAEFFKTLSNFRYLLTCLKILRCCFTPWYY